VLRYNGTNGAFVDVFTENASSGASDDVNGPAALDISGRWFCTGRGPCFITRRGPGTYDFQNERGTTFPNGRVVSDTEIDAWELKGIIRQVGGRMTIAWSNGSEWVRVGPSSDRR
jgi:hypothetical protein